MNKGFDATHKAATPGAKNFGQGGGNAARNPKGMLPRGMHAILLMLVLVQG